MSVAKPDDAARDDVDAYVLKHECVEGELDGIEGEVLFGHVVEGREEHSSLSAAVLVLQRGVGLVVEDDESLGASSRAVAIVEHIEGAAYLLVQVKFPVGVLTAVGSCLVEHEVHAARHFIEEA